MQSDFQDWKTKYELENLVSYVLDSSQKQLSSCEKLYFYCHRSHDYEGRGSNIRSLKSMGTNKMNAACPSTMEVEIREGIYYVKFFTTHVGHGEEIGRVHLNKNERAQLAGNSHFNYIGWGKSHGNYFFFSAISVRWENVTYTDERPRC